MTVLSTLVKEIWSSYIKESHGYQLTRKTQLLKQALKTWRKTSFNSADMEINKMKKEMESFKLQLMQDPLNNHLWLLEQEIEMRIQHLSIEEKYVGVESTKT